MPPWLRRYVGIPFVARGRDHDGCDCWGLVRLALGEQFGLELPRFDAYRSLRERELIQTLITAGLPDWRDVTGTERAGDVVLLRLAGRPLHVGLVVARGTMLHIEDGIDACLERYDGLAWRDRVAGIYRHRDMPA